MSLSRLAALLLAALADAAAAETLAVGAAANLAPVLEPLHAAFRRAHPEVRLTVTTAASGSLFAQIQRGAPLDALLSADVDYPRRLIAAGAADPGTLRSYARGTLVLWLPRGAPAGADLATVLAAPGLARLALAQPRTAPYGRAAEAALAALGLTERFRGRLAVGESVAQAAQFAEAGAADAAFVPLSVVRSPRLAGRGRWLAVPARLHPGVSLEHAAVLTLRGAARAEARQYLDFLTSAEARAVWREYGYAVPAAAEVPALGR